TTSTIIFTLSLHDALPIYDPHLARGQVTPQLGPRQTRRPHAPATSRPPSRRSTRLQRAARWSSWVTSTRVVPAFAFMANSSSITDRKSTRLNSSHVKISYA